MLLALAFGGGLGVQGAPASEWKDPRGATFKGEPIEALGPLAVWRTGPISSKFLPMRTLSEEDVRRFHAAVSSRAPRAERWTDAKGEATRELVGGLVRSEAGRGVPVDFDALPEPELMVMFYVGQRTQDSWLLLDNLAPFAARMLRVYPGRVVPVVIDARQRNEGRMIPSGRSWFVLDRRKLPSLRVLARFGAGEEVVMLLMTRDGVPLFGSTASSVFDVMKFVDGAADILWQLNPANPRNALDRGHYLRITRPLQYAESKAEPLLLAQPLRVDALRQRGISQLGATLAVDAEGRVTQVQLRAGLDLPAPLANGIAEALRRNALFAPAIERGAAVAAPYEYALQVPPVDAQLAAEAAWVQGEARFDVPIASWLVLKSVKVPEQVFSTVDRVSEDGTVMLKAVTAGSSNKISTASQMNAFNSDWFGEAGAGSVRPVAGAKQEIDGTMLTWKKVTPEHGFVDFLGNARNLDYCIGYAWTEVEVPEDTEGWLGIGSDDGLKIWLNGEMINDRWIRRTSRLDDDVVPVKLKKGKNAILIKIQNAMGRWSFTCRLRGRGR